MSLPLRLELLELRTVGGLNTVDIAIEQQKACDTSYVTKGLMGGK